MYHPHIPHPRILSFWMNTLPAAGLAGVDRVSRMTLSESGTTFCLSEAWQIISQLKSSDVVTRTRLAVCQCGLDPLRADDDST